MGHSHSVTDYPGHIAGIAAISATIGALTALFITPRSGDQMRDGIKRRASSMRNYIKSSGEEIGETIDTASKDIKSKATEIKGEAKQAAKEK